MAEAQLTWHQTPRTTKVRLPSNATDCHCHVFGPTSIFPYADSSSFRPADAPKEALFALHDQMGIEPAPMNSSCVRLRPGSPTWDGTCRSTWRTASLPR